MNPIPNIYSKLQYAKTKWDGAVEPTINNFYEFITSFLIFFKCANRTKSIAV